MAGRPAKASSRAVTLAPVLLPVLGVMVATAVIAWAARDLLVQAQSQEIVGQGLLLTFLALLVLAVVATALVFMQAARSARRLVAPVHRITVGMQRIRQGDLAHRVHLRRHDELSQIASELNQLLDWLNENPPAGARTGGDVVEMDADGHYQEVLMSTDVEAGRVPAKRPVAVRDGD